MAQESEKNTISLDEKEFDDVLNAWSYVGYNRGYKTGYKAGYKEAIEKVKSLLLKNALGGVDIEE